MGKKKVKRARYVAPPTDKTVSDREFNVVVAASPNSDMTISSELDLIKVALLYGDRATIISPLTTLLLGVEAFEKFSILDQIELVKRAAPVLMSIEDAHSFEVGAEQLQELIRAARRDGTPVDRLFIAELLRQFDPIQQGIKDVVKDLSIKTGIDQLETARGRRLVDIENADPGDSIDLIVACITAATRADLGEAQDSAYTNRIVDTFVDRLSDHLSTGRDYLIFDETIADIVGLAIREGLFSPAEGPSGRSAQAMAAATFMHRLPTFPSASVDEVIDIRDELAAPLIQFRSAMVSISNSFESESWESDFDDALNDAWVETVYPAIKAIEESVRANKSLLALASGVTGNAKATLPGLAIVFGGVAGHEGFTAALGGALSASSALTAVRGPQLMVQSD